MSDEVDYAILGDDMQVHAGACRCMQVVEIELASGETVIAEAAAMNYMDDGIGFETRMGDGGEGLFLARLRGSGVVYLQSLPFARLAHRILRQLPRWGQSRGEGSLLGGPGNMLMGDNR